MSRYQGLANSFRLQTYLWIQHASAFSADLSELLMCASHLHQGYLDLNFLGDWFHVEPTEWAR